MNPQNIPKALSIALLTSLIASLISAATKYMSAYLSVHLIISLQYGVGLGIALPMLLRKGYGLKSFTTQRPGLHIIRAIAGLVSYYSFYLALVKIPLVEAQLLRNAAPLFVPLIIFLAVGIKIPRARYLPLAIGFIGVIIVLRPTSGGAGIWHLVGLCSAIALASSMVSTRLLVHTESSASVVFYFFTIALIVSLPLAVMNFSRAPLHVWGLGVLSGVGLYMAMQLYTVSFRYAKPSIIAPITYFGVVFTGLWGWLFWQQVPDTATYIGIVFVVCGAIITMWLPEDSKA